MCYVLCISQTLRNAQHVHPFTRRSEYGLLSVGNWQQRESKRKQAVLLVLLYLTLGPFCSGLTATLLLVCTFCKSGLLLPSSMATVVVLANQFAHLCSHCHLIASFWHPCLSDCII